MRLIENARQETIHGEHNLAASTFLLLSKSIPQGYDPQRLFFALKSSAQGGPHTLHLLQRFAGYLTGENVQIVVRSCTYTKTSSFRMLAANQCNQARMKCLTGTLIRKKVQQNSKNASVCVSEHDAKNRDVQKAQAYRYNPSQTPSQVSSDLRPWQSRSAKRLIVALTISPSTAWCSACLETESEKTSEIVE